MRVIISGGGTGGHIFPAIAIANEIKNRLPEADILFVGAKGRMEMEKVPAAGYEIVGLQVRGFQRKLTIANLVVLFQLMVSLVKAKRLLSRFKPDIVIGVGGYASGPMLQVAAKSGIPTLVQEQNSYPGITNKLLAKKVNKICVAYDKMHRFFPEEKIVFTGNPVRKVITNSIHTREEAHLALGLDTKKKTILVVGGSLGARTINKSIAKELNKFSQSNVQVIWQTGKNYHAEAKEQARGYKNVQVHEFIHQMDIAFAAADVILSRAGASTISELCLVGKPCIFVPSPNVAEDHQTKNAMALVEKGAALLVPDADAERSLVSKAMELLNDTDEQRKLSENIHRLGINDAPQRIVDEALQLIHRK